MAYHVVKLTDEGKHAILESCAREDDANDQCDLYCDRFPFAYIDVLNDEELAESLPV